MSRLIRPVPVGGSSLVRDYLQGAPEALTFYNGSPFDLDSYRRKLVEVGRRFGKQERAVAAASLRHTSAESRNRLDRFVEQGGAMVTTGQQAGFLTGPLYTVFKAYSAAALARHLEQALGTLILPIFWIASEDHDWEEVNHAILLDPHNRARRIGLNSTDERALPMSQRALDSDLSEILEEVRQTVGNNGDKAAWVERIVGAYRPGRTVAEAFGDAMAEVLAPADFLIADAANEQLKTAARPVYRRALAESREQHDAVEKRTAELAERGYREQVAVLEDATNVFLHMDGGRERVYRRGAGFGIRGQKESWGEEELLQRVEEEPDRFSGNVFLRPVVESYVYPTLAYVGGPGELAYFAQVAAVFETYGIEPPVVVPRFAGQVVEPKVERLLSRLELDVEDTEQLREVLLERLARREMPEEVRSALERIRTDLAGDYERLIDASGELGDSLQGPAGASRNRAMLETTRIERKILRSIKKGDRIATEQLDRVLDSLRPTGKPQDRVLNVLPFLARYGDHFLREVQKTIEESWRLPE